MMWGKAGQRHISKSTNKLKIWKIRSVNGLFRSKHNQIKSAKAQDNASFTAFSKKFLNSRPSKTTTNLLAEKGSSLQKNLAQSLQILGKMLVLAFLKYSMNMCTFFLLLREQKN